MIKNKIKKVGFWVGLLVVFAGFSACSMPFSGDSLSGQIVKEEGKDKKNPDEMKFSDPGNDKVGKEVKEIDKVMNEVSQSDYDENEFSKEKMQ